MPRSGTTAIPGSNNHGQYPFGTNSSQPDQTFNDDAGTTVNDPTLPQVSSGFDGQGNTSGFSNKPFNTENYQIRYSTTNATGETGYGIGNLPAKIKNIPVAPPPEETAQFTATFDPRAYVIFQDADKENPNDPPQLNKQFFTLENDKARDGSLYFSAGLDSPPISGSFVKSYFNPRTNMMTYYYFDSWSNKWIISTQPFTANPNVNNNLSVVASR